MKSVINILLCLTLSLGHFVAQQDTISEPDFKKRQKTLLYGGAAAYTGISTSLYFAWYKQNPQSGFHFFDDSAEWLQVDKLGHVFSAYQQSNAMYKSLLWAGIDDNKAIFYSSLASVGFQSTIEVMDGFSSEWGFSVSDMVANVLGTSSFALQQRHWREQRIKFKMSYWNKSYPTDFVQSESGLFQFSLAERAEALFGNNIESFLKDYNGQSYWLSFNLKSFLPQSNIPKWLAVAVGYSGENMYGGFENRWEINDENIIIDPDRYPRYRQFVIALDYDLEHVRTSSPFLRTLLDVLNAFKWPAPAVEFNRVDGLKFHLLFLH